MRWRSATAALGLLVLGFLVLGITTALHAAVPEGSIDEFVEREMQASGAPGLAYAIVTDGELERVGARGVMRIGGDTEVTPDTPFQIGSISKSFTAVAVMQLVEAGELDLDTEVSQYLDELAGAPGGSVTLRQLLSHTSGFSTLQGNTSHTDSTGEQDELARAVERVAGEAPAHEPGTRWGPQKLMFVGLVLAPIAFLSSTIWAWRARETLRSKSGAFGLFSLWFPLLTTSVGAGVIVVGVPVLSGVPLGTLRHFQPDLVLALTATAVTGPVWALCRLGVAYTGRVPRPPSGKSLE